MPELPELKWIPLRRPVRRRIGPPPGLKDFQQAWFWNLLWESLEQEPQGYLDPSGHLWRIAEAQNEHFWNCNKAVVLAVFDIARLGEREMLYYPPLLNVLEEQKNKLKNHKERGDFRNSHSDPQRSGKPSPSQSDFAFDLASPIQIQKQRSTRARAPARETKAGYSQPDFDERDLRKWAEAWKEITKRNAKGNTRCAGMSIRQIFEAACSLAGVTIARGLELDELRKKWPERVPDWLKETG